MSSLNGEDVVFVGLGRSVPSYYRCALPAFHLGCRWIGYSGYPPDGDCVTGNVFADELPTDVKVYVVQQVRGPEWMRWIREAQSRDAIVLYETDDYVHGIKSLANAQGDTIPVDRERLNGLSGRTLPGVQSARVGLPQRDRYRALRERPQRANPRAADGRLVRWHGTRAGYRRLGSGRDRGLQRARPDLLLHRPAVFQPERGDEEPPDILPQQRLPMGLAQAEG